jgi:O-antigen/teichoic acid export membrane protein
MKKKQIVINAGMSILQVVILGGILFFLYRYLLMTIGVDRLGIWSIVLAATSTIRVGDLGFSGSVVKFVAKYLARGEPEQTNDVIQTAVLSIAVLIGLILLIAYPLVQMLLGYFIPKEGLEEALLILPYALLSLWISSIAGVFQSGLVGCQRIDLLSLLLIASSAVYFGLVLWLIPPFGMLGLAYAQLMQSVGLLLLSWMLLKRELRFLPLIPYRWSRSSFVEMLKYGVNFQVNSIVAMLCDPITKALLSKFGGLAMVGYYEMANRMVMQFRAILVSANQVLVPVLAGLHEKEPERISSVYRDSYRLLFFLALPFYGFIVALSPIISELWIGHYEWYFVVFAWLLTVATLLNGLINPAYFSNLGTGRLYWNTTSYVVVGIMNASLGWFLGSFFGGIGVVVAWTIAFSVGSSIVVIAYHVENQIPFRELFPRESLGLALMCLSAIFFAHLVYLNMHDKVDAIQLVLVGMTTFCTMVAIPMWRHPMRARLLSWVLHSISGRFSN